MTDDREEQQRVLGIPLGAFSRDPDAEEPQRVLGFPVEWFAPSQRELHGFLERYVPGYRRWAQRRGRSPHGPGAAERRPPG